MKEFDEYQDFTDTTAKNKGWEWDQNLVYPVLGLVGEAGEVSEKLKKIIRDQNGVVSAENSVELAKELGDVLWYIARIARQLGIPMSAVAELNMLKLKSRKMRNRIGGSGDNR